MKYKVGDRIWTKYSRISDTLAQAATIIAITGVHMLVKFDNKVGNYIDSCSYRTTFDFDVTCNNRSYWQLDECEVYEYKIKNTKIAKKLNKNNIEKETREWLWISPE